MKYLSLIIFFVLLQWSWNVSHRPAKIGEDIHIGIQDDLKKFIENYIKENLPTARNLKFDKFWTETIKKDKVKASFSYSFEDQEEKTGPTRVQIEGFAVLNHDTSENEKNEKFDYWNLDELSILNNNIDFKDPLQITVPHSSSDVGH